MRGHVDLSRNVHYSRPSNAYGEAPTALNQSVHGCGAEANPAGARWDYSHIGVYQFRRSAC